MVLLARTVHAFRHFALDRAGKNDCSFVLQSKEWAFEDAVTELRRSGRYDIRHKKLSVKQA
jgi:hypothetical protein